MKSGNDNFYYLRDLQLINLLCFLWNRYKNTKSSEKPKRRSHYRVLSDAERQNILDLVKNNPTVSSKYIKEQLNLTCSERTVRSFLIKSKLRSRIQPQKDALNDRHIRLRYEFANEWLEHEAFNNENINKVIFTDEKTFSIGKNSKGRVRRPRLARLVLKYLNKSS